MGQIPTLFSQTHNIFKDLIPQELEIVEKYLHLTEVDIGTYRCKRYAMGFDQCFHDGMRRQRDGMSGARQSLCEGNKRLHVPPRANGWDHDFHSSPMRDGAVVYTVFICRAS